MSPNARKGAESFDVNIEAFCKASLESQFVFDAGETFLELFVAFPIFSLHSFDHGLWFVHLHAKVSFLRLPQIDLPTEPTVREKGARAPFRRSTSRTLWLHSWFALRFPDHGSRQKRTPVLRLSVWPGIAWSFRPPFASVDGTFENRTAHVAGVLVLDCHHTQLLRFVTRVVKSIRIAPLLTWLLLLTFVPCHSRWLCLLSKLRVPCSNLELWFSHASVAEEWRFFSKAAVRIEVDGTSRNWLAISWAFWS